MLTLSETQVKAIKKAIGSKLRKAPKFKDFRVGMSLNSYWDSGSRDYFYFINLNTMLVDEIPQNGTPFDKLDLHAPGLNKGDVLVEQVIMRGKEVALYIYS